MRPLFRSPVAFESGLKSQVLIKSLRTVLRCRYISDMNSSFVFWMPDVV